jgi:hypothetical protein
LIGTSQSLTDTLTPAAVLVLTGAAAGRLNEADGFNQPHQ